MKFDLGSYGEFQKAYEKESDRSVAILASSYLEKYLEEYIAKKLVDDKAVAKLFEGFGPLSTFNAKIEFAFAIGLLPRHVYTDLRTIRKVRNLFAHEPDSSDFLTDSIKDLCATLWRLPRSDGSERKEQKPRSQFLFSVFLALFHMENIERTHVSRLTIPRFHFEEVVEEREEPGGNDSFTVRSVAK
jgi:DNA-binding MltR family transcriptional regulator